MNGKRAASYALVAVFALIIAGCGGLHVNIGAGVEERNPSRKYTLEGTGPGKVLIIHVRGFLSDEPKKGFLSDRAGIIEEVTSQLRMAEKDKEVRAVILAVNSPGGSVTASDILYHEIVSFKERSGAKVVAVLMDLATSGGYYIALPADRIVAHSGTITGSVGVIFIIPKVAGLMDKLGLSVEVRKSGRDKDMASPFRPSTPEEQKILDDMTQGMGRRFQDLVVKHRKLDPSVMAEVATARIYPADEALRRGLIDRVGYTSDAIRDAKEAAGLSTDAKVIAYRRTKYPNDNIYNTSGSAEGSGPVSLFDLNLPELIPSLHPGFYYLWTPGTPGR